MKKLPIIVTYFCTVLFWCHDSHTAEWKDGVLPPPRHASTEFFDFDNYEAQMASLRDLDREDEQKVNTLYAPLDIDYDTIRHALNLSMRPQEVVVADISGRADEDGATMERISAESLRTAALENAKREVDTAREQTIEINNRIGKLIQLLEERTKNKEEALDLYLALSQPDPEIEALENNEEKARRLKERQEQKDIATKNWLELANLHTAAKADLVELERVEDVVNEEFMALSTHLDDLKRQPDGFVLAEANQPPFPLLSAAILSPSDLGVLPSPHSSSSSQSEDKK